MLFRSTTTSADRIMKDMVLADVMSIVIHKNYPNVMYKDYKLNQVHPSLLGGFEPLIDETINNEATNTNLRRKDAGSRKAKFK